MKNILLSVLIGSGISVATVFLYSVFINLYGKYGGGYVKLFFLLSIIGGGVGVFYFLYSISKEAFFCSLIYGLLTSFIVFFLIGFIVVNIYGS